jgi:hypothetical protein
MRPDATTALDIIFPASLAVIFLLEAGIKLIKLLRA